MTNANDDTTISTLHLNKRLMGNVTRLPVQVGEAVRASLNTEEHGEILDFWGDEGVCSLGYNTPQLLQAIQSFLGTGAPHQLPDVYPNKVRWDAAELICRSTEMDRIFFANSGAEANETAIKLARKFAWDQEGKPMENENYIGEVSGEVRTRRSDRYAAVAKRHVVLTVAGNFHGRTAFAMAAADFRVSPYHRFGYGPLPMGFGVLDPDQGWQQVVTDGREHEARTPDWSTVAAVTLAPVLGNNVVHTYSREFWEQLGALRKQHGFLIIHDDVQAGSGRAGHFATYQGLHEDAELVRPDILCLGKGIALGFPMSAVLASERVTASFTPGVHFNTFGGSPWVCHMASVYYRWLGENLDKVRANGERIRLAFASRPWIKHHDGMGMLNAFTPDFERFGYSGYNFSHRARDFGLSLVTHRPYGPIRFTPPMNISDADLARALDALDRTHLSLIA